MQSTLLIEGRMFGRTGRCSRTGPCPPRRSGRRPYPLTLRDLITRIVLEEVQAFRERRAERRLIRALTESQIAEGVGRGKVEMGGREDDEPDVADPEAAVATALLAFEDGLYYVFVDNEHRLDLNEEIRLRTESRVTFLRLVALAGG